MNGYPVIVRDVGPASSGGASKTQKVKVRLTNGWVIAAHAKFALDVNGADVTEGGKWGVTAEIVASEVARAIGAEGPNYRPIELPAGVPIALRGGQVPLPGVAAGAPTLYPATDVNGPGMLADIEAKFVARVVILDTLMAVGDRGHNMIRGGEPLELHSLDYASGLTPERNGVGALTVGLVVDGLVQDLVVAAPATLRAEVASLEAVLSNETVDEMLTRIPDDMLPIANARQTISAGLRQRRDALPDFVAQRFPAGPGQP